MISRRASSMASVRGWARAANQSSTSLPLSMSLIFLGSCVYLRTARYGHTPRVPTDIARPTGPIVVAVVAGLAHLVVGWFYLAGGLVIPGAVLIPLWILWLALAAVLVRLAVRRSWWTPAVPVVAAVVFVLVLVVGEQALGWQA
jgi:hypothetical protein